MHDDTRFLERYLTPERKDRLRKVLANRTRNLVLGLEDIYDPHNASACLRSAEAMGVQEVQVIASRHEFRPAPKVTNGADKWLDVQLHESVDDCITRLKARGIHVAAGAIIDAAMPLGDLDFSRPTALFFGNEHDGISDQLMARADQLFYIPMLGFTQSFNLSVAAAIALYYGAGQRVRLLARHGDLSQGEREELYARWVKLSVPMAEEMLARYHQSDDEHTEDGVDYDAHDQT